MDKPKEIPTSFKDAVHWIMPLIYAADKGKLDELSDKTFFKGWAAISFLYPGLHPDERSEHDAVIKQAAKPKTKVEIMVNIIEPRLHGPYYSDSGWPVVLNPILEEAWKRARTDAEIYQTDAQQAGLKCKS